MVVFRGWICGGSGERYILFAIIYGDYQILHHVFAMHFGMGLIMHNLDFTLQFMIVDLEMMHKQFPALARMDFAFTLPKT